MDFDEKDACILFEEDIKTEVYECILRVNRMK